MAQHQKNQIVAAAAVAGAVNRPYTRPDAGRAPVTGAEAEALHALDRRLTDGLNLVHAELAVLREEVREIRREAIRDRKATAKEFSTIRQEMAAQAAVLRQEMAAGFADVRQEMDAGFADVRQEMDAKFAALRQEMNTRFASIEAAIQNLAAATQNLAVASGKSLERGSWLRRLAWGLGGVILLLIGALARPLGERVVAALFGG